jgi:ADP-ribosylglycohydrolase
VRADDGMTSIPSAAADSLRGLALGDSFGERWFFRGNSEAIAMIRARRIPEDAPWHWTDDTAMALAIVHVLRDRGEIEPAELAAAFAANYVADPYRGYGYGMTVLLPRFAADPVCWSDHARELFDGQGSLGNGAAMRVAPLGAWFGGSLDRSCAQARLSAQVTHAHPEGIAGAVTVAATAALAAATRASSAPDPAEFLRAAAARAPEGAVRDGVVAAAGLDPGTPPWQAADILGNGQRISAADTVPFALWSAAHHLDDLPGALWTTAEGLGDVDTTCAITAGVVSARTGISRIPRRWLELTEPLPDWIQDT